MLAMYRTSRKKLNINTIMESGQCFSISKIEGTSDLYKVLSDDKMCVVQSAYDNTIIHYNSEDDEYWTKYFQLNSDNYQGYISTLCESQNPFLVKCAKFSEGMVILKQDTWETIVSFIISQRKSIPAIKTSLNRLRDKFGVEKEFNFYGKHIKYKTFPDSDVIGRLSLNDLSDCGMGYRAEYVLNAAKWVNSLTYDKAKKLTSPDTSYDERMSLLKEIRGVGDKVANCICLFALSDMSSFPVDIWIQRAIDKNMVNPDDEEFKDFKGFAQQVVFYYIIKHKEYFV